MAYYQDAVNGSFNLPPGFVSAVSPAEGTESRVDRIGRFVILLAKTGRDQEALTAYLYLVSLTKDGAMVLSLPNK